jgi:hypothetical protein
VLVQMTDRLFRCDTFERAIWTILDDAIALLGAEYGNVQLITGQELVITAQRGLPKQFLEAFRRVRRGEGRPVAALCCSAGQL